MHEMMKVAFFPGTLGKIESTGANSTVFNADNASFVSQYAGIHLPAILLNRLPRNLS